jgi:hypothetical protein
MQEYFYATSNLIDIDSIVLPGNWGRLIKKIGVNHNRFLSEYILDNYRKIHYPQKLSRLNSLFLCESLEEVQKFIIQTARNTDLIYKGVLIDPNPQIFKTNWDSANVFAPYEEIENICENYWNPQNFSNTEILTNSRFKVTEILKI